MRCDVPSARKLYDSSAPTWILHVPDGRQFQTACFCRMHRNMQKLANMTCGGTTSKDARHCAQAEANVAAWTA